MTPFQKKILFTIVPFLLGFMVAYGFTAFIVWQHDASMWTLQDRVFATITGWVVGSMLYMRFEYDRVR